MSIKFIYHLDFILKTELTPQFETSFAKVIEAHHKHEKGLGKQMQFQRSFAAEKDIIQIKVPMESLNEMDLWQHTPEIVLEYFGRELGMRILQDYCDATQGWNSYITKPYDPLAFLSDAKY
jgi:hypothetical protein